MQKVLEIIIIIIISITHGDFQFFLQKMGEEGNINEAQRLLPENKTKHGKNVKNVKRRRM